MTPCRPLSYFDRSSKWNTRGGESGVKVACKVVVAMMVEKWNVISAVKSMSQK